jgi:hypothetical protein
VKNWSSEREEEGAFYRRAAGVGGMNLDVTKLMRLR